MNAEEYERMYRTEDSFWWFQGRMRMIRTILETYMKQKPRPGRVIDVGCGTGLMLGKLKDWDPTGLDFSVLAMQFCRRRGIKHLVRGDVVKLPFQDNSVDLILALDLIEHVDQDDLMAKEFHRVLRPGGYLMATVPAHEILWSDHDVALHHFRRYSYNGFKSLLKNAGFKPVKYSYGVSFVYFPVVIFRFIQKAIRAIFGASKNPKSNVITLPGPMNELLKQILHVEAALLKHIDLPFGVSLMTLCRKPTPKK